MGTLTLALGLDPVRVLLGGLVMIAVLWALARLANRRS